MKGWRQRNSCWTQTTASGSDHFVTPKPLEAPLAATRDCAQLETLALTAAVLDKKLGLQNCDQALPWPSKSFDLAHAIGAAGDTVCAFAETPACFLALAIGGLIWTAMQRLLFG